MDPPTKAAADPALPAFSQVVFMDIPHSYPPAVPITCRFSLNGAFQPNSRDWVGIFKVGWSSTKDYHTFVWVETIQGAEGQQMTRQAVFKDYYLPKDEIEFYQFCYIDSSGQVRGASTPFCFRNPAEQNMESNSDDELLVITTQDQVDQSQREKEELRKELDLMRAENQTLKNTLLLEHREKEQDEQRETERTKMVKEMDQIKEHNEKLKHTLQLQLKENDRLKEELMIQMTKQMEIQEQKSSELDQLSQRLMLCKEKEEKYERAAMKLSQQIEEGQKLKVKIDAQNDEINMLKVKVKEGERALSITNDRFQLLQVDFQSSNKEKERLAAELQRLQSLTCSMDEVKRENQELCRRLSQQDAVQTSPQDDLKCQTLNRQLQEAQAKLVAAREESRNAKRQAEHYEMELKEVREQLKNVATSTELELKRSGKYELMARELNEIMAEKEIYIKEKEQQIMLLRQEITELTRENQKLKGDVERLRAACSTTDEAATTAEESLYMQPDVLPADNPSADREQQNTQENPENIYETIGSIQTPDEEPALVCRHCQERFPGITQDELEQHEQSHRVCPFCTMICDNMEQSVFEDHVYSHEL